MSHIPSSDPTLYSLKNILPQQPPPKQQQPIELPPLLSVAMDTSCQEKSIMIDKLIQVSANIIDSIWSKKENVMPTSLFIREILKRSRATYSMLQLALFYIFRIKKIIHSRMNDAPCNEIICCGRRMFLAALMCSSKYINDKNYKNKTWSKIASLNVKEINATEMIFLKLIDYQLFVSKPLYDKWVSLLHEHIQKKSTYLPALSVYHHPTTTTTTTNIHPPLHITTKTPTTTTIHHPTHNHLHNTPQLFSSPVSYISDSNSSCHSSPLHTPNMMTPLSFVDTQKRKRRCSFSSSISPASKHLRKI